MKAKKQWLSLFGVMAMAAALMLPGAKDVKAATAPEVKASISDVTAEVGEEITIPVKFSCDNDELKGCNGVLKGNYDETVLEYVTAEYEGMPTGMESVAGGNFGYVSGTAFKSGTINLKFKVLKCTVEPITVSVTKLTFSNSNYVTGTVDTLTSKVTINHVKAHYQTDEKAATCTEAGYRKVTCGDCGAVISDDILPAEGHDDGQWVEVKAATCKETGTKELHCTKCDALLDTAEIPLADHTWGKEEVITPATCAKEGEKLLTCTVCEAQKTDTIAKLPHTWKTDKDTDKDGWKVVTAATTEKEGSKERVCAVCEHKETAVIAKLTPANNNNNNKSNTNGKTNTSSGSKTTTTSKGVNTGDNTMSMVYILLALAAACGVGSAVAVKRRRVNH